MLGEKEELVEDARGVAKYEFTFGKTGNRLGEKYWNKEKKLTQPKAEMYSDYYQYAERASEEDEKGRITTSYKKMQKENSSGLRHILPTLETTFNQ